MRIHHVLALALLILAPFVTCTCNDAPEQTGTLCTGEPQQKPAELVPVSWPHAVYLPSAGIEFPAEVVDVAGDGAAELLITGLADTPAPGHPESITVTAACAHFTGPAALSRPLDVVWSWPTDKATDARAGAYAGTMNDGSIRVAVGGDPIEVLTLPPLTVTTYPAWIPDPSTALSDHAAAWEAACRKP